MIVFTEPISTSRIRMAYNNDVIRFYSDAQLSANQSYCDITMGGIPIRLYPDPSNKFFFNFKPYASAIVNKKNFEDTLQTDLHALDANSFIYGAAFGSFIQITVFFKVVFDDGSEDEQSFFLAWLAGAQQFGATYDYRIGETYILSSFMAGTTNAYYLKYWQGYPFDIPIFKASAQLIIENQTNLLSQTFDVPEKVNRLFVSDGRTDETLEDVLPLIEGYNNIRVLRDAIHSINDKFIRLEKVPYKCGVYFKWLNKLGLYNYWLFENTYAVDRSTKSLGEIDTDNANIENSFARTLQLGQQSQDTIKVVAELLTEDERNIVEGILESPKIYMFTGKPYARNDYRDWIEVSLKSTSARVKNAKQPMTNFALDFELPERFTQTI